MLTIKSAVQTLSVMFATLLVLTACASNTQVLLHSDDAYSGAGHAETLIDQIVRSADGSTLSRDNFMHLSADAQVVYLGERHDNERHHQLQLEILGDLLKRGARPVLAFEFFSVEQSGYLLQFTHKIDATKSSYQQPMKEERLRKLLGWDHKSDSHWERYAPLLRVAQQQALPVYGLDLPSAVRSRMVQRGEAGLTAVERRLLFPTGFENQAYQALMQQKLTASHCGFASGDYLTRLYKTWVARNDAMATAIRNIVSEHSGQPVVVLLGSGHVQHNMGVYERVTHLQPDIKQVNLGFREVIPQVTDIHDYIQGVELKGSSFEPDHEYLWFTPGVDKPDPCIKFRKQLKTLKGDTKSGHAM